MKRVIVLLAFAGAAFGQVQTVPNTTFPAVRTILNSNFSWLNTNKASTSATLMINGVTITLGAANTLTTAQLTESGNLYFTNARALSALAGLYEVPLTFTGMVLRSTNSINLKPCTGNDGFIPKWRTATGWDCEADDTGAPGGGITSLGGLSGATQTFAKVDDTNVTITIGSTGTTHTFTIGWSGLLSIARGGTGAATTSQNFAFIGPTSGSGAPSFRALVSGDIPNNAADTSGNAGTATALAANGANCSAGQIPLGVTAAGAAEGCYAPAISTLSDGSSVVTLTGSQTLTNKTLTLPIVGAYTVAGLPAATTAGQLAIVTDGASTGNCTSGGGSSLALCRASGSAWVPLGDGGSGHTQNTDTGTTQTTFQIDSGNSGPKLKNNAGVLEARNAADDDYADFRAKTVSAGDGTVAGEIPLYELAANGTNYISWLAPDAITNTLRLKVPNADPAAQVLNCAAPSSNISTCTWQTPVTTSSSDTFTNKTVDAEGTGNAITIPTTVWLPGAGCNNATASSFWDLPTSTPAVPACVTGTNTQKGVLGFADTSGGFSAQNEYLLPDDFTGAIDAKIIWSTSATSGNAKWSLSTICTAVGATETDDPAFNTASTVTTAAPGTANRLQTSAITGVTATGCAAGEFLHVKIFRDGNDGSDTIAATANLVGVELKIRRAM
jgi:hypothetical protein